MPRNKHLNWKDEDERSYAHASRAVGGKYEIQRCQNGPDWFRKEAQVYFDIRYLTNTGRGAWNNPGIGKVGRTMAEAKRMAEEDHAARKERLCSNVEG